VLDATQDPAYGASVVWITIRVIGDENGRSARWKFLGLAATTVAPG
jgi:hypothetical protein